MDELTEYLIQEGALKTKSIIDAFRAVDRADFVPDHLKERAYENSPLGIGNMQTISQPQTVAFMLEQLQPTLGEKVLDIGSGSGWTTALLAQIVGPTGSVLGLERVDDLITFGQENLARLKLNHAHIERAGTELGAPSQAPFDRILISASAQAFPHDLISQLTEGGVLVLPVRDAIWRVQRIEHQPVIERFEGYVFVPLIEEEASK